MNGSSLAVLAKSRLFGLVSARRGTPDWPAYRDLAVRLPHLVRHNGLCLTIDYLKYLGGGSPDRPRENAAAAQQLLQDWGSRVGVSDGLSLAWLLGDAGLTGEQAIEHKVLLDRLAEQEADLFKRYAEVVDLDSGQGASQRSDAHHGPIDWPRTPLLGVPPKNVEGHLDLFWRFAGSVGVRGPRDGVDSDYRRRHIDQTLNVARAVADSEDYRVAYDRRARWMRQRAATVELAVFASLYLSLGDRAVFETQVQLHPLTGLPYLAASALKSLLCRSLQARCEAQTDDERRSGMRSLAIRLTGDENQEGVLVFHDAWWIPGSAESPLVGDVDSPESSGAPNPIPQLAVRGAFLVAVECPHADALYAREAIGFMTQAAYAPGLGGRAVVGGGRMRPVVGPSETSSVI